MSVKINITGQGKVIAALKNLPDGYQHQLAAALYQEGEALIAEAKAETPVDTGALRASGHVLAPEIAGDKVTVRAGFGGPAAPYAVFVHENLEAHHNVGNAKYLENPAKRRAATMAERIAEKVKDAPR